MVSGTTAMEAPIDAFTSTARSSSTLVLLSAGCALSIEIELMSSSSPPPTWKLAIEMPKKDSSCSPMSALTAITTKALKADMRTVRLRWASE
ncbi:hypothetical protein D9M69_667510 [compost metagenome]